MRMRIHIIVPLIVSGALLIFWAFPSNVAAISILSCIEDHLVLVNSIELNRDTALRELNHQLVDNSTFQRETLIAMREQVWDDEERQLITADIILRDCQKAASK